MAIGPEAHPIELEPTDADPGIDDDSPFLEQPVPPQSSTPRSCSRSEHENGVDVSPHFDLAEAEDEDHDSLDHESAGASLAERLFSNLSGATWGAFRFTPVPSKGAHGYYQARCPRHRRNLKTDCKQELPVLGPERKDKEDCIRRLLYWCTMHSSFDRQRKHRAFKPTLAECPSLAEIVQYDAKAYMGLPRPATDEDLDAAAAVEASLDSDGDSGGSEKCMDLDLPSSGDGDGVVASAHSEVGRSTKCMDLDEYSSSSSSSYSKSSAG